jgi:hypothetical protein
MKVSENQNTLRRESKGILEYSSLFWESLRGYSVFPAQAEAPYNLFQLIADWQHYRRTPIQ